MPWARNALVPRRPRPSRRVDSSAAPVVPPPDGFALSTSSDVHNQKMSAADYDAFAEPGAAARDHFATGYEVTYDIATDAPD